MIESIRWSLRAEEEYAELLDYLVKKWGKKVALEFKNSITLFLTRIMRFPELYPAAKQNFPSLRRAVISKQTTIIYRLRGTGIEIVRFWDNRQDPVKNKV